MDSAIQPLNNRGLVDSVTHLLNKRGLVNKIIGSTLKVSLLHVKILLVLKSVLGTLETIERVKYFVQKLFNIYAGIHCLPFISTKKDRTLLKHACKFLLPLYIISKIINNSNRKCSHRSPAYLRT